MRAIQGPAAAVGREITDAAAQRLVDELRLVNVQRGSRRLQLPGPVVEPVQLQVVCSRLWDAVGPRSAPIDIGDVEELGDVEGALGDYYAERVARVSTVTGVPERALRDWFDEDLITPTGFRAQRPHGPRTHAGSEELVTSLLLDAHLIRAEDRRGARWLELAHDRLIEPVRRDNARWREANLSDLQRRAARWEAAGRPEGLLLGGRALDEATSRLTPGGNELTSVERQFWQASLAAGRTRDRLRRASRVLRGSVALAAVLLVAIVALTVAVMQFMRAAEEADIARSRQLAAEAWTVLGDGQPHTARLLALEAARFAATDEAMSVLAATLTREGQVFEQRWRTDASVQSMAFGPDGRTLASASGDGTVQLWNADTGEPHVDPLTGHTGWVNAVAFSPDGQTLASAGEDTTIRLWNADTGEPHGDPLDGHTDPVNAVAFSPDGRTLASAGEDTTIRLWNPATGEPHGEPLTGHTDWVNAVAFSPDGRTLASASNDAGVRLWDPETGEPRGEPLTAHDGWVNSVAFNPRSESDLATAGDDGTLRSWEVVPTPPQLGAPILVHEEPHRGSVNGLAHSPDGQTLAVAADDTIHLWDPETGEAHGEPLTGHTAWVTSVAFSPDGQTLVTASDDTTIRLWDPDTGEPHGEPLTGHDGPVNAIAFSPDGQTLASAEGDTIRLWDPDSGEPRGEPLAGQDDWVNALVFDPDGATLVSGSDDGTVRSWYVSDASPAAEFSIEPVAVPTAATSLALSNDGVTVATGGEGSLKLYDVANGEPRGDALPTDDSVVSLDFAPDDRTLASASDEGIVRLWDPDTGEPRGAPLTGHDGPVNALTFSPDGRTLASASDDTTIRLWDPTTGEPHGEPLTGHTDWVTSVAFSPDGQTLASASDDATIRLWDAETGEPRGTRVIGDDRSVTGITFTPDGRTIATTSSDGHVGLWNATSGELRGENLASAAGGSTLASSADSQMIAVVGWDGAVAVYDAADGEFRGWFSTSDGAWVSAATFGQDGESLVTSHDDGTVRTWTMDPRSWIVRACRTAQSNLSGPEWDRWLGRDHQYEPTCPNLPSGVGALAQLNPPDVRSLTGRDAAFGQLLLDIDAAESAKIDFQLARDVPAGGFTASDDDVADPLREEAASSRSQLLEVRGRLDRGSTSSPTDRVRVLYVEHLDAWAEHMRRYEEGTQDPDPYHEEIGETASEFADALEEDLPDDLHPEVRRFAESILNRGFRTVT